VKYKKTSHRGTGAQKLRRPHTEAQRHRGTGEEDTTEFCCPADSLECDTEFHGGRKEERRGKKEKRRNGSLSEILCK